MKLGSLFIHSALYYEEACPKLLHLDTIASAITIIILISN